MYRLQRSPLGALGCLGLLSWVLRAIPGAPLAPWRPAAQHLYQAEFSARLGQGWVGFGLAPSGLEMMAWGPAIATALCALWLPYLTYRLGQHIAGPRVGLVAALMVAVSPSLIHQAQDMPFYALSAGLGLAGTLALLATMTMPSRRQILTWLGLRAIAVVWLPLLALFLVLDVLLIIWRHTNRQARWFKAGLSMGLLAIAIGTMTLWAGAAPARSGAVASGAVPNHFGVWLGELIQLTLYWPLPHLASLHQSTPPGQLALPILFYGGVGLLLLIWLLLPLAVALREEEPSRLPWIAALTVWPWLGLSVLSWVNPAIGAFRYLTIIAPYSFVLIAIGGVMVWRVQRPIAIVIAAFYALAVTGGLVAYYTAA